MMKAFFILRVKQPEQWLQELISTAKLKKVRKLHSN